MLTDNRDEFNRILDKLDAPIKIKQSIRERVEWMNDDNELNIRYYDREEEWRKICEGAKIEMKRNFEEEAKEKIRKEVEEKVKIELKKIWDKERKEELRKEIEQELREEITKELEEKKKKQI